jgi:GTPase SAR1 family protein
VYDISNRESFDHISEWAKDVNESCPRNSVIVLVGNKKDLDKR